MNRLTQTTTDYIFDSARAFTVKYCYDWNLRRKLQEFLPGPLLQAPFVLMTLTKYVGDAFYPAYSTELLTLIAAGLAQATSVWARWFL